MIVTFLRTALMYLFVTVAIRLMGKRQIGDMQPNELVVTLLISEIAAIPLQDNSQPVINGVVAIFTLVILEILISVAAMKSFSVRKLMSGKSVVIIKNGIVDENAMKKVRMTVLDLIEMLRSKDVFDISRVAYAVLEVNGNLSILLKSSCNAVTLEDLKIQGEQDGLPLPVICDGKLVMESLEALGKTKGDIEEILESNGCSADSIFLLTLDRNGGVHIVGKKDSV